MVPEHVGVAGTVVVVDREVPEPPVEGAVVVGATGGRGRRIEREGGLVGAGGGVGRAPGVVEGDEQAAGGAEDHHGGHQATGQRGRTLGRGSGAPG